jgi:hypothetical protein
MGREKAQANGAAERQEGEARANGNRLKALTQLGLIDRHGGWRLAMPAICSANPCLASASLCCLAIKCRNPSRNSCRS